MTNSFLYNNKTLDTRKALITGGASGIGWATAHQFHQLGASVVITDIKKPSQPLPEGFSFIKADVGNPADVDYLFGQLHEKSLLPNCMICCAGIGIGEQLTEGDPEKWQQVLNTNLLGVLRCVRAFAPQMLEQKKGDIVLISSVAARKPYPWGGVYSASKAALLAVAETLRMELQPTVKVCSILPGVVDTDFFENSYGQSAPDKELQWGSLSAADIADAILYVLTRPSGVAINEMVLRPVAQVF